MALSPVCGACSLLSSGNPFSLRRAVHRKEFPPSLNGGDMKKWNNVLLAVPENRFKYPIGLIVDMFWPYHSSNVFYHFLLDVGRVDGLWHVLELVDQNSNLASSLFVKCKRVRVCVR